MTKQIIKILVFPALFLAAPVFVFAAPSISAVGGSMANGQTITVSGNSFGSSGPNTLFFDNFEGGAVGQNIKTGTGSATIGQWSGLNTVPPKYSSRSSVSGSNAFEANSVAGIEGQTNGFIALPNTTQTFLSWWSYVPSTSPWSGEGTVSGINWKSMWMYQTNTTDNDLSLGTRLSATQNMLGGNNSPLAYPDTEPWQTSMVKGKWHRFAAWVNDGYSNDGTIKIWELTDTGSSFVRNVVNKTTLFPSAVRKVLSVNAYTRDQGTGTQSTQLFDDVYVATGPNAQARIEIGNAPTYASSTNLTLATTNSWSDASISATLRQGSFANGENAYLYVIDASGSINVIGYPITFGSGPADTSAPATPSGLVVM